MKKVILYIRLSTDEQAIHGFSLRHQLEALKKHSAILGYTVIAVFQDDFSAKTFNRPEYLKLETYCKANKKDVDLILFTRWDRFSRNCEFALSKIRFFKNIGIEVNATEQPLDFSTPDHKIMLSIYLTSPEVENDKNSLRTTEGSRRARKEGCWTGPAPFGYANSRTANGKSTLTANEKAIIVKRAFDLLATGIKTSEQVRRELLKEGLNLRKQAFLDLTKNIVYTGKIRIKAWQKDDEEIVDGLHTPIIDEDLFWRVQALINSRNRLKGKVKVKHVIFPLRGFLQCRICEGNLTGSGSTSRNKERHFYYHCQKGCRERFKAEEANTEFEKLLLSLELNNEITELYREIVKDVFVERQGNKEQLIIKCQKEIEQKQELLDIATDKWLANKMDDDLYKGTKNRLENIIRDKKAAIEELKSQGSETLKHFNYCISLMLNLKKHYLDSDIDVKNKFIGSIFSEKLIYAEKKYRTTSTNSVFLLFDTVKADKELQKNKKASISAGLPAKAPQTVRFSNHFLDQMRVLSELRHI